ncbi:cellulase family glycosylhydrolase [Herpetosiphon geysericola]|uniref:Exo-1,3-beta-glucanase D n=1 Tax=Herpetosiphon geysericola TaxID=70996 RepID=A0A0P6Y6E4_9CHLR|nr:cellulase family glycosylhydrolase [Herpetosiphon geysericola]KPL91945.1 glycoside hydrolase [Herpetosiphon geysericola]
MHKLPRLMVLLTLLSTIVAQYSAAPAAQAAFGAGDFLKANGPTVRNNSGNGTVVTLKGTNLGGWLLQEGWMSPLGYPALPRTNWTASGSAAGASAAIDGNPATRWTSNAPQANGQWFQVDLGANQAVERVTIDAGSSTGDYPRQYQVQAFINNAWLTVGSGSGTSQVVTVQFNSTQVTRLIRVLQTGSSGSWWSIHEFNAQIADEFNLRQALTSRFGSSTADSLIAGYQDTWIQASDLDTIKAMGLNMVRVPIHWLVLMNPNGTMKSDAEAFRKLDWLISESSKRNLYVMLDLHGAPGAACPWHSCGQTGTNQLWTNATYQNWTVQIWERLATRYRGNPTVAAYDLLNEPLLSNGEAETAQQIRQKFDFFDRLYDAVRAKDPDHMIVMAAFYDWYQALSPATYGWTNVMYQLHHYNFDTVNDWNVTNNFIQSALDKYATFINDWNVPGFAGEYWFSTHYDLYEKFMSGLNALNVSWTNWTYKVNGGGNWGFYQNNTQAIPDLLNDSAPTIADKWSRFSTNYFQPNTQFQNTVRAYAPEGSWVALQAGANSNYVSADNYGNNPLVANRPTIQGWEKFRMITNPDGTVSFMAMANNKYVVADLNQGGRLVAQSRGVLGWEKFRRVELGNGTFGLQAMANNKYVTTDLNSGSPVLIANRDAIGGAWEAFTFVATAP